MISVNFDIYIMIIFHFYLPVDIVFKPPLVAMPGQARWSPVIPLWPPGLEGLGLSSRGQGAGEGAGEREGAGESEGAGA